MALSLVQMIVVFVIVFAVLIGLYYFLVQGAGTTFSAVLFDFFGGLFA